jgi:predicted nucleotidyltransferase
MLTSPTLSIPPSFPPDLDRALRILKEAGRTELYLCGSLARGEAREDSDIDWAANDFPKGK